MQKCFNPCFIMLLLTMSAEQKLGLALVFSIAALVITGQSVRLQRRTARGIRATERARALLDCKYGALATPVKTASGGTRRCKKRR